MFFPSQVFLLSLTLRAYQVERTFKQYDRDGDGKISIEEWHTAIKKSSGLPKEP